MIGIDPVNNIGYAPLLARDGSGNAQVELVDLTVGATTPLIKTLPMVGAISLSSIAYNPNNKTMLVEASTGESIEVFVIDTATQAVVGTGVTATGLTTGRGGILEDLTHNRAFVAGQFDVGILDTSVSPPAWNAASVVTTVCSDSLALNQTTGILFMSCDGTNQTIDTTQTSLTPLSFESTFDMGFTTDGVAFDPATNIMILSPEFQTTNLAFNFATLDTAVSPSTANDIVVPGLGSGAVFGEGPGGEAVIDCTTHQAITAGEDDQNFELLQLPTSPVATTTPLDNNGQPGSGTTADAASVYNIASAIMPTVDGTTLFIQGDPNALTIDPAHDFVYVLATSVEGGGGNQYLVRIDLTTPPPPLGGSPTGTTQWIPAGATTEILLP